MLWIRIFGITGTFVFCSSHHLGMKSEFYVKWHISDWGAQISFHSSLIKTYNCIHSPPCSSTTLKQNNQNEYTLLWNINITDAVQQRLCRTSRKHSVINNNICNQNLGTFFGKHLFEENKLKINACISKLNKLIY